MATAIAPNMTFADMAISLARGNSDALLLLASISRRDPMLLLDLDDMGVRGNALVDAANRFFADGGNAAGFCEAIRDRTEAVFKMPKPAAIRSRGFVPSDYEHPKARVPRCPDCKFRMRGPNHAQGEHHKSRAKV